LKKAHAERNEQLNDQLIAQNIYRDWVVTTAFYSAIHYVEHKLFVAPFRYFDNEVKNLEDAHSVIPYKLRKSRHETRGDLVKLRLYKIQVQYDFLRKQSQTARYVNYVVSEKLAKEAKGCLNKIKAACTP
jgi:hypothetical protein